METEKVEMEQVTIKVPKAVMDFLRAQKENIQSYLEYNVLYVFVMDIESCEGVFGNYSEIMEKFALEPVFKALDVHYTPLDC